MAIRVRKLARQLGRSPEELVELLGMIGLGRYSKHDDMLPGNAEEALREAVRRLPPPRRSPTAMPPGPAATPPRPGPLGALFPGVKPMEPLPPVEVAPAPAVEAPAVDPRSEIERASLARIREELTVARAEVEAERSEIDAIRADLERERAAVRHERARVREVMIRAEEHREEDESFLAYLLRRRGLRGMDECERAIAALAERRQLRPIIELLRCDRPDLVTDVLEQRLVLVGGQVPESLPETLAAVSVAPDRADVPGRADLTRALARFGEILLLHGLRRVTVVGGRPAWHKTLREGLDPRVELRFHVALADSVSMEPLALHDLCILWGVSGDVPEPSRGRGVLVKVGGDHLLSLLTGVEEFLRRSAA